MSARTGFAYAQARLQARHGQRPDTHTWHRLRGSTDLAGYLHAARKTALAPWVAGLHSTPGTHDIEDTLRQVFRDHVDEVAHWVPASWRCSIHWLSLLPDLPAMRHLLSGAAAPAWMLNNARLRPFTSENLATRMQAMLDSNWHAIVLATQDGQSPTAGWLDHWQALWPRPLSLQTGMHALVKRLRRQTQAGADTGQQREWLGHHLQYAFRRYSFQPAAACAHLGLVALDLEQLRAELVTRALFSQPAGSTA